jgi:hypothetical protein
LAAERVEHAEADADWQPPQTLATQKLFAAVLQSASPAHSTHCPAAAPLATQVVFPSLRAAQPVAPTVPQPVQALATQKAFPGSFVHSPSPMHSTHLLEMESQTWFPHAVLPAASQPTHAPATQKALVGSVQSPLLPQVPAASGT